MKILVIRFSSLGDVVLITPLFQKIKNLYPSSHLSFLTDVKYVPLFYENPYIDDIIGYEVEKENLHYFFKFLKNVKRQKFDIVIDCHRIIRSILISFFSNARRKIGVRKFSIKRRIMVLNHRKRQISHIVDRYLNTVGKINKDKEYRPNIFFTSAEKERINKFRLKIKTKIVGFVPGASKKTKIWEISKYRKLAQELIKKGSAYLIFFGGYGETSIVKEITEGLSQGLYLDLSGKTTFRELSGYIKACDVLFTTDSGPMHIAVAVKTPVVAIFGPTVPEFGFTPYDDKSIVISKDLPCKPCSLHGTDTCPEGHHNCMKLITVDEVLRNIEKLLWMEREI